MNEKRIQRAVSADGTEIVGLVVGHGPALVLVHGGIGHGDLAWEALLPHLTDRFTCYLPAPVAAGCRATTPTTPHRAWSRTSQPSLTASVSRSASWGGRAAAHGAWGRHGATAVVAVAAYEPVVPGSGEPDMPRLGAALEKVGMAAAEGRLVDAVRAFAAGIGTDDEVAALEQTTFFERQASAVPALLNDLGQDNAYEGPVSIDP